MSVYFYKSFIKWDILVQQFPDRASRDVLQDKIYAFPILTDVWIVILDNVAVIEISECLDFVLDGLDFLLHLNLIVRQLDGLDSQKLPSGHVESRVDLPVGPWPYEVTLHVLNGLNLLVVVFIIGPLDLGRQVLLLLRFYHISELLAFFVPIEWAVIFEFVQRSDARSQRLVFVFTFFDSFRNRLYANSRNYQLWLFLGTLVSGSRLFRLWILLNWVSPCSAWSIIVSVVLKLRTVLFFDLLQLWWTDHHRFQIYDALRLLVLDADCLVWDTQ